MKKLIISVVLLFGLFQVPFATAETSRISNFKATTDPVSANPSNYSKTFTFTYTAQTGDPVLSDFKVECDTSKSASVTWGASVREFKCSYPKTPVTPYNVRVTPQASGGQAIGLPAQISVTESGAPANQTPTSGGDYTPKNVVVCKVSDTSTKISWTTTSDVNSGLEWSLPSKPGKPQVANTPLKDHSITISGLTKGTKYGYAIYMPLAGEITVSAAKHTLDTYRQFTAGVSSDETKCNSDGTAKKIDTGVKINNIQNLDQSLGSLYNPLNDNVTGPGQIIVRLINMALFVAGVLAVIFIIVGGFLMVTSAGNENRLKQGKQTLIWAIAGLILTLLSFSIVAIVQSIIS